MKEALEVQMKKAFATVVNFQILKVDLPNAYEASIVQTQVEVQLSNMRKFQQEAELIRQKIGVMTSRANQQIRIINATAYAEAYRIQQFATVKNLTLFTK